MHYKSNPKHTNRCLHCPTVTFDSFKEKRIHCVSHHMGQIWLPCNICDQLFKTREEKFQHTCRHHYKRKPKKEKRKPLSPAARAFPQEGERNSLKFQCPKCIKGYSHKATLENHLRRHEAFEKGQMAYVCKVCGKHFDKITDMALHHKRDHLDKIDKLWCSVCNQAFKSKGKLVGHNRRFHEQLHICIMCGKNFTNPKKLKYHVMNSHGINPDRCPRCPDHPPFSSYVEHEAHVNKFHHGIFAIQCVHCPEYFEHNTLLRKHQIEAHPDEKRLASQLSYNETAAKSPCPLCGQLFRDVEMHIGSMHRAREFKCDQCDGRYPTERRLNEHRSAVHEKSPCPDCGLLFSASNLVMHKKRVHTPSHLQPYQCPVEGCGKGFHSRALIKKHMYTHTGEKPYKCKLCPNVAYADSGNLAAHNRSVHKGLKRVKK